MRALGAVVFLLACLAPPVFAQPDRPPVVLITLDTFRADHVGANGARHVATPHLDRLANGGVNFTRARSPVPLTLPSHASILTGRNPPSHGVRDNGTFRLAGAEATLAERLQENGYRTAAFVGAFVLDHRFGLAQGFDLYDDRTWSDPSQLESPEAERVGEDVYAAFAEWMEGIDGQRPFFAWIHLFDPHAPYEPPEPFRSRHADDPYSGEVAYTDAVVGRILDTLETKGILSRTLVAAVGDHGEGLGEHGESTHALLIYNSTLHVPMMLFAPALIPHPRTVTALVRTIDLAPTVLDLLGLEPPAVEGRSLRPLIEGRKRSGESSAYSESLYASLNLRWSELRGLETAQYRYIAAPEPELYDLEGDPKETTNLHASLPNIARELARKLASMSAPAPSADGPAPIDSETRARLRSLGYLSAGTSRHPNPEPRLSLDPKSKMDVWRRIQLGIAHWNQGSLRVAAEIFRELVDAVPQTPLVAEYLGSAYRKLGDAEKAEKVYRRALERGLESSRFHLELGRIHFSRRELRQAARELEIAVALDPLNVPAHFQLGEVFRAAKRMPQAVEHYQNALDINPDYVYALNGLGVAHASMGKNQQSLEAFQRAVKLDPRAARPHLNLAIQLERMGRDDEALVGYRTFLELAGGDALTRERRRAADAIRRIEGRNR